MTNLALIEREEQQQVAFGQARMTAGAAAEIQAAVILAKRFKRSEDEAYQRILKALDRFAFADKALYEYKRGKTRIEGPSVYLARECAKYWGNLRYGAVLTGETTNDEGQQVITGYGYCWDIQNNVYEEEHFRVPRLVQRKDENGVTQWVVPDERDLREVVGKAGALATRNCILRILPEDYIADFCAKANATLEKNVRADPQAAKKALIEAFGKLNIPVTEVEAFLKCPLDRASPKQLVSLRNIWKSVANGEAVWYDFYKPKQEAETGSISFEDLQPKAAETAPETPAAPPPSQTPTPEPAPQPAPGDEQPQGLFETPLPAEAPTGYEDQPKRRGKH